VTVTERPNRLSYPVTPWVSPLHAECGLCMIRSVVVSWPSREDSTVSRMDASRLKQLWFRVAIYTLRLYIAVGKTILELITERMKLRGWHAVTLGAAVGFIMLAVLSIPAWLFWRLFFSHLKYWHMLVFITAVVVICTWHSVFRSFRERHLIVRIVEQVVVVLFLLGVVLLLAGKLPV